MVLDEALFDVRSDPGEGSNLAYRPAHAGKRKELFGEVRFLWGLLGDGLVGLGDASRAVRQGMVAQLAGCFNSSVRCHTPLGRL